MLTALPRKKYFVVSLSFLFLILTHNAMALPPIVVPMDPSANVTFYSRNLVPNPLDYPPQAFSIHLDKMDFQELDVHKGQSLQIDSLVLCENTLAIISGLTRGTDAISLGEIQSTIDTKDRREFLRLVLEMARLRRHAESIDEWNSITKTVKGTRAHWNAYLFKTDFVVVVAKSASADEKETRVYIPLSEVLDGAGEIDLESAKLGISQSMAIKVLEGLQDTEDFKGAEDVKSKLAQCSKSLDAICNLKNHEFKGESPVGCFITDLGYLHCAGKDKKFRDSDSALLRLRKQIALLQLVRKYFPTLPGLEELDALVKHEHCNVNCNDQDTLFVGLEEN